MRNHGKFGLALALVILVSVWVTPSMAAERTAEPAVQGIRLELPNDGSIAPTNPTDPGVESTTGDPEDWLGGQNVRKDSSKPPASEPVFSTSLWGQFETFWKNLLIAASTKLSRQ